MCQQRASGISAVSLARKQIEFNVILMNPSWRILNQKRDNVLIFPISTRNHVCLVEIPLPTRKKKKQILMLNVDKQLAGEKKKRVER